MNKPLLYSAGILAVVAAGLLVAQQALVRQPKITWSSRNVYASLTSTTTVTHTLSFTSDQPLQDISLEAVPAIAQFVSIQPNVFAQVPAAQPQTVILRFSAPDGAQFGAYEGTIHIRTGYSTLPQPLQTSVTYAVVPLPPDPGEPGKTTLAGIDADGDGARDDVQRYIALTVPDSARHREALKQQAIAIQHSLIATTKQQSIDAAIAEVRAVECLDSLGKRSEGRWREVLALMLNTESRIRAEDAHEARMGGQVFTLLPEGQGQSACTFDVEVIQK